MNTFIYLGLESLQKRLKELDIILSQASTNFGNDDIYNTFCRSAQVLLVAHFEGSVKDLAKNILDDINYNIHFKDSPMPLKRTFCEYYLKDEKGKYDETYKDKLIELFDSLPTQYRVDPFLYEYNRNPSPKMIEHVTKKFGISSFFSRIENSRLDLVFQGSKSDINQLKNDLKNHLIEGIASYPYSVDLNLFGIVDFDKPKVKQSLWETFIDELLKNRHEIAHGNTLDNLNYHEDIENSKVKVEILIYALMLVLCKNVTA